MKQLFLILFCCLPFFSFTQEVIGNVNLFDKNQRHLIKTKDGDEVFGRIIGLTEDQVSVDFKGSTLTFQREELVSIKVVGASEEEFFQTGEEGTKVTQNETKPDTIPNSSVSFISLTSPNFDMEDKLQKHLLETKRGDRFVGRVLNEGPPIEFKMDGGSVLFFEVDQIKEISVYGQNYSFKESKNGDYIIVKPVKDLVTASTRLLSQNRLFISNTGFGLKAGENEYRNTMLFSNTVNHGFSDHFSMGGGVIPLIGVNILTTNVKFTFDANDYFHFGLGAQTFYAFGINGSIGSNTLSFVPFASVSIGTDTGFFNFSYNYFSADGENIGIYGIGFSIKSGNHFRLFADAIILEDINFDDTFTFVLLGGSWFNNRNKIDFGMGVFPASFTDAGFIPFPIATYTRRF